MPYTVVCANWTFLDVPPYYLAGAVLVMALFVAVWLGETRLAAVVVLYGAAFMVVGKSFVTYWALMYSPLLAVGIALSTRTAVDLIRKARGQRMASLFRRSISKTTAMCLTNRQPCVEMSDMMRLETISHDLYCSAYLS